MNYLNEPVQCLSNVMAHAQYNNVFENIAYVDRNWDKWRTLSHQEKAQFTNSTIESRPDLWMQHSRSPRLDEMHVVGFFPQTWSSTALGFSGIGGAAMTQAYSVVLKCENQYAVYFGNTYAYCITNPNELFFEDMSRNSLKSVRQSHAYFERVSDLAVEVLQECSHVFRDAKKVISEVLDRQGKKSKEGTPKIISTLTDLAAKKMIKIEGSLDSLNSCKVRVY